MQERRGPPGSVTHCDDGNLYTDDDCDGMKCEHDPEPGPCDAFGNGCATDLCQDMPFATLASTLLTSTRETS